jgi:hypothetical protein
LSELGVAKGDSTIQSSAKDQTTIAELQAKIQDFEVIFTDLESEKQEVCLYFPGDLTVLNDQLLARIDDFCSSIRSRKRAADFNRATASTR